MDLDFVGRVFEALGQSVRVGHLELLIQQIGVLDRKFGLHVSVKALWPSDVSGRTALVRLPEFLDWLQGPPGELLRTAFREAQEAQEARGRENEIRKPARTSKLQASSPQCGRHDARPTAAAAGPAATAALLTALPGTVVWEVAMILNALLLRAEPVRFKGTEMRHWLIGPGPGNFIIRRLPEGTVAHLEIGVAEFVARRRGKAAEFAAAATVCDAFRDWGLASAQNSTVATNDSNRRALTLALENARRLCDVPLSEQAGPP